MGSRGILESHRILAADTGTAAFQRAVEAMDLGEHAQVTLVAHAEYASSGATLYFQSAPEPVAQLFTRVSGASVSLATMGAKHILLSGFSRYVRWEVYNPSQVQVQFSVEVVARNPQP